MKRFSLALGAATVVAGLFLPGSAGASITGLPQRNPNPVASPAAPSPSPPPPSGPLGFAPITGASWAGISDFRSAPPDPNGAIGPKSYIEVINSRIAVYTRTGTLISSGDLSTLTGHANVSDPMVLWDPDTQRFYYNVWDTTAQTMEWGFSKTNDPTSVPASFCNYTGNFGYAPAEFPDYPKLGQSKNFLMIGINHYPTSSAMHADRSDLLWIDKPQGRASISVCPPAPSFRTGRFTNLRNQDQTQAFTPVPSIQDDPSSSGWVVSSSDIECPDICGTGTKITVHTVTPKPGDPTMAVLSAPHSIIVAGFQPPVTAGVPQKGTTNTLDALDGRLEHAVAAVDPGTGKEVIWTGHTVRSASGRAEFRWYEILPTPLTAPTLVSFGTISHSTLDVFNGAVAPDRTVNTSGAAHGNAIVIGFTTSSSKTFPADWMVSKIGAGAVSPFVLVHQSTTPDTDFTCTPKCRWGDYGGATSDPAQSLTAPHGEAWLSNEAVTSGNNTTWNWEAKP